MEMERTEKRIRTKAKVRIRILDSDIELKKFKRRKVSICRSLRYRENRPNKSSVLSIMKNGFPFYNIYDSNWKVMMKVRL